MRCWIDNWCLQHPASTTPVIKLNYENFSHLKIEIWIFQNSVWNKICDSFLLYRRTLKISLFPKMGVKRYLINISYIGTLFRYWDNFNIKFCFWSRLEEDPYIFWLRKFQLVKRSKGRNINWSICIWIVYLQPNSELSRPTLPRH